MMSSAALSKSSFEQAPGRSQDAPATAFPRILAYVDATELSKKVVTHAMAVAEALHAPLTLLRVIDVTSKDKAPTDPVEWSIRRREAHDHAKKIARSWRARTDRMDILVVEGQPVEQICLCAREQEVGLTVVGTNGGDRAFDWELGDIARKLIERASGAVLLVPPAVPDTPTVHFRRLLVPLDGSCRAESVLPLAARLARAEDAELLLAHVIPVPEFTETGPLEAEDHRLRDEVTRRNERVARQYLDRIQVRLAQSGIAARSIIVQDGDVRGTLARLVADENVDMMILSSHGRSGRSDVACGSVAAYMVSHVDKPLLIALRPPAAAHAKTHPGRTNGRPPSRSTL